MSAELDFRGMDTVTAIFHNASPRATAYLAEMMDVAMAEVFEISQVQVPRRTGALAGSGHQEPVEMAGNDINVSIGYGGPAAQYALFVHENLQAQHASPTKAKFLEDPMNDVLDRLISRLQGRMEGAIVGEYPGSPARAAKQDLTNDLHSSHAHQSAAQIRHGINSSPAMSADDITRALRDMRASSRSGGNRTWRRA